MGDHARTWDSILPIAQFAYNNSVNRTIGMSPFEVVHSYKARKPLDVLRSFLCPHKFACLNPLKPLLGTSTIYTRTSAIVFTRVIHDIKFRLIPVDDI